MKTILTTILIAVLTFGLLMALAPSKAEAWHGRPAVGFSVVLPPFGLSIGTPYYYPGPVYVAPPYPFYGRAYYRPFYRPFYGYRPYYGYRSYWGWRGDWDDRGHGRWHR